MTVDELCFFGHGYNTELTLYISFKNKQPHRSFACFFKIIFGMRVVFLACTPDFRDN